MATSDQLRDRIEEFARQLSLEMGEVDDSMGVCWLDAIENQAMELSDALHAQIIKKKSSEREPSANESTCPECGKLGQYQGPRERELVTQRGPATIVEPEYYCPCCRKAFFPADPTDRR